MQDELCRNSQEQKALADKAWVNRALELKADTSFVANALHLKADHTDLPDHGKIFSRIDALGVHLECMQDELCRTSREQTAFAEKAWVVEALKQKADHDWIEKALTNKADKGDHENIATLRMRLECLQDEVCRTSQEQKGFAEKAWVIEAIKPKVDRHWVEATFQLKSDQGDHENMATLRTRLECLQDEVCFLSQGQKGLAEKAWVHSALELKADIAWVTKTIQLNAFREDPAQKDSLRIRLECLHDDVCRIEKSLKDSSTTNAVLKAYVEEQLAMATRAESTEISSLHTRLTCLQDEVCRIAQSLKSSNADLGNFGKLSYTVETLMETVEALSYKVSQSASHDPLQRHVHTLARRLHSLIFALINVYKRGSLRRVGGGYEYDTVPGNQEVIDALNLLIADGMPLAYSSDYPPAQQGRPPSRSGSRSPSRTQQRHSLDAACLQKLRSLSSSDVYM
jgi:hypothetical protein